ncbi:HAD family hydrolase [Maribacter chungangensis]|uniref:HAD family hydrolase n=1 Tax=Maribacter chungangensis TaxID=1069117 RepID=A0ABW3B2Z5_9FLAO
MIKNIVFDFGDIFLNLDKPAVYRHLEVFGHPELSPEMDTLAKTYEVGKLSSSDFLGKLQHHIPNASISELTVAWNSILLDFPESRLTFLEQLKAEGTYRLFLLSNTNELHIQHVKKTMGTKRWNRFEACFEQFYLSHEIQMRKPNTEIFEFVLNENGLVADKTLFIDDTQENTDAAASIGIRTWHLIVGSEDVTDVKTKL